MPAPKAPSAASEPPNFAPDPSSAKRTHPERRITLGELKKQTQISGRPPNAVSFAKRTRHSGDTNRDRDLKIRTQFSARVRLIRNLSGSMMKHSSRGSDGDTTETIDSVGQITERVA